MKTFFITLSLLLGLSQLSAQMGNVGIDTTVPGSKLTVNGSFAASYANTTSNAYNLGENDFYLSWLGTAAGTITLPDSTTGVDRTGRIYYIKNSSSIFPLTIDANGSEMIDNSQTIVLQPGKSGLLAKTNVSTATGSTYQVVLLSETDGSYIYAVSSNVAATHNQGVVYKADFNTIDFSTNGGADFNLTTDTWTCPKSGYYKIEFMETGRISTTNVAAHRQLSIVKNGIAQTNQFYTMVVLGISALQAAGASDVAVLNLQQGDTIYENLVMCLSCGAPSMSSIERRMIITKL